MTSDIPALELVYDYFMFDDHVLDAEPEQATLRALVTVRTNSGRTTLMRHVKPGIRDGSWHVRYHRKGQELHTTRSHLLQIANAAAVTMCLSAAIAVLNQAQELLPLHLRVAEFGEIGALDDRIKRELWRWNALKKDARMASSIIADNNRIT